MTIPKTLATQATSEIEVPTIASLAERVVDLKTLYLPENLNLQAMDFTGIIPTAPIKTPSELSFLYPALAETVQAVINGKITEFISYDGAGRINDRRFRVSGSIDSTVSNSTSLKSEVKTYKDALKEILDDQGSKGFPLSTGEFADRLNDTLFAHKEELLAEEKRIYSAEQDDILEKVEEGIKAANTAEIILFDSHNHIQAVTLEAAIALVDNAYNVFNIEVEKYNSQIRNHSILIASKLDEMRDKILPLDEFNIDLKGKVLENENARLSNALYTSAIRYIIQQTESINSNIDLLELEAEQERQKITRYRAEVNKFEALVNQNVARTEAYRARVRAEAVKLETYKSEIRTAEALLRADSTLTDVNSTQGQADVDIATADLSVADAELTEARVKLENAVREGRVIQTDYDTDLMEYTSELQNWFTDTSDEIFRLRKFRDRTTTEEIEDRSNKQALKRDQERIDTIHGHKVGFGNELSLRKIAVDHIEQVADVQASTKLISQLLHKVVRGPTT